MEVCYKCYSISRPLEKLQLLLDKKFKERFVERGFIVEIYVEFVDSFYTGKAYPV